jgi:hypothetical protein
VRLRGVQETAHRRHHVRAGFRLGRAGLGAAGPPADRGAGSMTTTATSARAPPRCWSSTPGSTPTTFSTRTFAPTTSPSSGTSSTGLTSRPASPPPSRRPTRILSGIRDKRWARAARDSGRRQTAENNPTCRVVMNGRRGLPGAAGCHRDGFRGRPRPVRPSGGPARRFVCRGRQQPAGARALRRHAGRPARGRGAATVPAVRRLGCPGRTGEESARRT